MTTCLILAHDRSLKATAYVESQGNLIASSKVFDIHFPLATGARLTHEAMVHTGPVEQVSRTDIAPAKSPSVTTQAATPSAQTESPKAREIPANDENEGTLSITASNAGADIFVDSTGRGKAPTNIKLKPGKHSVQVVLDGYQDWVQEVSVEVGETATVTANLRPVTTTLAETQPANTASPRPKDGTVEAHVQSPASSVRQEYAPLQTKNEDKPVPVANSSASDSGGWIGITGITGAYGVIITDLESDGPAREAGLKIADTIIGVDDTSVKTIQMMDTITSPRAPGSKMKISYIRNGVASETTVTVQRHH